MSMKVGNLSLAKFHFIMLTKCRSSGFFVVGKPASESRRLLTCLEPFSGTGNVVCLDSDTDSEQSFERWRLKPCSASQPANLLEKVVQKDDEVDYPLPVEQSLLDHYGPVGTPVRDSSVDRDCTLDPFGSGRFNSPIREGPAISSTSKRPASSLWARDGRQKRSPHEN